MNKSWLPLKTVQVARETAPGNDGMGGLTTATTTMTTLTRAAIYQAGNSDQFVSDKVAKASTHVLVCEGDDYTWSVYDKFVVYNSAVYSITGVPDDVSLLGKLTTVGLERIQ